MNKIIIKLKKNLHENYCTNPKSTKYFLMVVLFKSFEHAKTFELPRSCEISNCTSISK